MEDKRLRLVYDATITGEEVVLDRPCWVLDLVSRTGDAAYAALAGKNLAPNTVHLKEQAQWGYDHAILGGQVLLSWKLPQPIPQIVACHHQPTSLLQQHHDADSEHVKKLAQSPDGTRAGLNETTLMELWDDLRTVRREALSVFK